MLDMITGFVQKLTIEDVNKFALKNQINLSASELEFTYGFVKNNYQEILKKPNNFDFSQYKNHYSATNYTKIEHLIKIYANYL